MHLRSNSFDFRKSFVTYAESLEVNIHTHHEDIGQHSQPNEADVDELNQTTQICL